MNQLILTQGVDILNPGQPQSLMIVGVLALLLTAAINYRNPMAAIGWAMNVIVLVVVGVLRIGVELFWLSVIGTVVILMAGLVVRGTA